MTLTPLALLVLATPHQDAPQTQVTRSADPLAARLTESGLTFTELTGFYSLTFTIADSKRKQTAFVRRTVEEYRSLKVREVFSLCWDEPTPPSRELLAAAFQKRFSIGGLTLEQPSETQKNWRIRFRVDVPADMPAKELRSHIEVVEVTADSLEAEFNPGKEDRL